MKNSARRFLKWTVYTLLAAAVIHAALLIASGLALRRSYDALRAAGRPMTLKEVIPPRATTSGNGASLYMAANELLNSEDDDGAYLMTYMYRIGKAVDLYLESPDVETNRLAMERFLANPAITEALSLIERATRKRACRFDVSYELGAGALVPHASFLLNASRIVAGKLCVGGEGWSRRRGVADGCDRLRMADVLRHEPMLISQLVRIKQISTMCKAIHRPKPPLSPRGRRLRSLQRRPQPEG